MERQGGTQGPATAVRENDRAEERGPCHGKKHKGAEELRLYWQLFGTDARCVQISLRVLRNLFPYRMIARHDELISPISTVAR